MSSEAPRLKVLHLFESYLRNTENWCYRLISHLPETDVVVGSTRFLPNNFYSPDFAYLPFPIQTIDDGKDQRWVRAFNRGARLAQRLYPRYLAAAARDVAVIHSHYSVVGWRYRDLPRWLGVPHVVSFYGFDYEYLPFTEPTWYERYRRLFAQADLFVCEGTHGADLLAGMGCPRTKIRVARLGVEIEGIPVTARRKSPQELSLIQVASMTDKKGHVYTVSAFLEALQTCSNMTLCLVGSDPAWSRRSILAELQALVRDAGAEDKVRFVSSIPFSRLHEYLNDFQVFIHPSVHTPQRDSEGGAPVVLLDAQATGMPVIATRHCDIPDEVIDEETGLLADEADVAGLARAIERFYHMSQSDYDVFVARARGHAERAYDIARNALLLKALYDELVSRR